MEKLKIIREMCVCTLLLLLCGVALHVIGLIDTVPGAIRDTRAALVTEFQDTRVQSLAEIDKQADGIRSDVRGIARMADHRTGEALGIVRDTSEVLTNPATGAVAQISWQLGKLNTTLADTLRPVKETAQQVDDAAPLWLDCEYNPDCAFNRYQGVSKAFEQTAQTIAKEAPKMTASVDKIAVSSVGVANSADLTGREVARAAQNFNRPQTKMQQFRSWLLTLARIYGAI